MYLVLHETLACTFTRPYPKNQFISDKYRITTKPNFTRTLGPYHQSAESIRVASIAVRVSIIAGHHSPSVALQSRPIIPNYDNSAIVLRFSK